MGGVMRTSNTCTWKILTWLELDLQRVMCGYNDRTRFY